MAIYSLNHKAIGKSTQDKPYTAAAHIRYITRANACREVLGEHMPTDAHKAQRWFREEEKADRKNARMCDKVMVALPRELNGEQRHALVKEFAEIVTESKTPWLAAIHDKGKDQNNPHCHIVFRDRDPETGKRVLHMSAGKKERSELGKVGIYPMHTDRIRVIWEKAANKHLEKAGYKERIDRRTLEAQGIEQEPTVHEGAQAHKLAREGKRPESKVVEYQNAATAKSNERLVDYTKIDNGRTRQEYNRLIRQGQSDLIKEFAKSFDLGDDYGDGRKEPPEITRQNRCGDYGSRGRKKTLGREIAPSYSLSRRRNETHSRRRKNHLGFYGEHRQDDNICSGNLRHLRQAPEKTTSRSQINHRRNIQYIDYRREAVSDEKILDDILESYPTEGEKIKRLKSEHRICATRHSPKYP